mmetsp:Transcript_52259/g.62960  ORF Transcript_52259/g.62960 Transcript_52259/m.62960 type:complete len:453 (-) Transcript_52259:160-1518(-)|eukprot:CAMPEP_0172503136 /NCGR_PEP_ID=MMETSP1066-20121228/166426_1 /TAXON_ID=671091 /ORGANISM="Coscinodiscus wailesii, Strain CCMP2513" /LENGTH=452 /DNA_ID=CAMNT_0013278743 /DNA_START=145 /DNA_END=1503 /DNA_ORIENTATION=-
MSSSDKNPSGLLEDRVDLSAETTSKITQAQNLITTSPNNLHAALTLLAALEKQCRVGNDLPSLVRVCESSIQFCKDCNDDDALIATLKNLSTRRSQKSKAISAMVSKAIGWVLEGDGFTPKKEGSSAEMTERLVVCLRDITDGKIFLEAERARLTRALAMIKEKDGKIAEAADCLQEVHVETYGSLSKREKVEFILEQMRLTLAKCDYVRAAIVAGKINRKVIAEDGMEDEKIKFFTLLSQYHTHERDAFELAKDYHHIYSTPSVREDDVKGREALQSTVLFLVLSPYSNEQQDMMNRVNNDASLEKMEPCKATLKLFLTKEIISYPTPQQPFLESLPAFTSGGISSHWRETMHTRIIQHNIRVAASYYRRIHGARLAQLLNLDPVVLEREISNMVSDGGVYAKIDRPKDIIRFAASQSAEEILSDWASDVKTLLHLVEKTTHLIHKENMTQ